MGLQEFKESAGNPNDEGYRQLPVAYIPFAIVIAAVLGMIVGYIIVRVAGL